MIDIKVFIFSRIYTNNYLNENNIKIKINYRKYIII